MRNAAFAGAILLGSAFWLAGCGGIGATGGLVWRNSVRIGCAIYNCPSTNLMFHNTILCDYAPGGNITNQKPY